MKPSSAFLVVAAAALAGLANAATYHVAMDGSNANPGSESLPWRTLQHAAGRVAAGDTVLVRPGVYGEYVSTITAGTPEARITFRAVPPNDPEQQVVLKQFRVRHPHYTFEGFKLTGAQNSLGAYVRIEADGSGTILTNSTLCDGVYLINHFTIDDQNASLYTPGAAWAARGFEVGGDVYMGGVSLLDYVYDNHNTVRTIREIQGDTIFFHEPFVPESRPFTWIPVFAGRTRNGITGIDFVPVQGVIASNCVITHCTITNIWGHAIILNGQDHVVAHNTITDLHSYSGLRVSGGGHMIRDNFFYNCTNIIHYTAEESRDIVHPTGSGWYDFGVGFIHSTTTPTPTGTNVWFIRNWIHDSHNSLGQVSAATSGPDHYHGFHFRSNVFVGVATSFGGGRHGLTFEDNLFYRVGFDKLRAHALGIGGRSADRPSSNLVVRGNIFVDVGSHRTLANEGYYSVVHAVDVVTNGNFVAGPETTGWGSKRWFNEPDGINGGDPVFWNADDPLGPDGLPFTDDDGLRPLPNSPIALAGLGPLPPVHVTPGQPLAHFTIDDLSSGLGWHDVVGTDFNQAYAMLAPFERHGLPRPWDTPEALGAAPVTVVFSAGNSISAVSADTRSWEGITRFIWSMGDGVTVTTLQPRVEHTYHVPGTVTVQLTVSDGEERTGAMQKRYRVLGAPGSVLDRPRSLRVLNPS